jgi:hypothetical protein
MGLGTNLYAGSGIACAGQRRAIVPLSTFSKDPRVFESVENFGAAPPIGSARTKVSLLNELTKKLPKIFARHINEQEM